MTMKFIGSIDYKDTLARKLTAKIAEVTNLGGLNYLNRHAVIEGFMLYKMGHGYGVVVNREFCNQSWLDKKDAGILAAERIQALCAQ